MSVYCKSYNQSFSKKSKFISLSLKLSVSLQKYQSLSKLSLSVSLQNYHYQSLSKIIIISLSPNLSLSVFLQNYHYQYFSKTIIISLSPKLSIVLQNYQCFKFIPNYQTVVEILLKLSIRPVLFYRYYHTFLHTKGHNYDTINS